MDHKEISEMEWGKFEQTLVSAGSDRSKRSISHERDLRDYFGDKEFELLKDLAISSRLFRTDIPPLGNIVFLPGIMGSDLSTRDKSNDDDVIWVNLIRLAAGYVRRLKLAEDGSRDADPAYKVFPSGIDKRTYARAVLTLRTKWNVETFPFDWRKDIDDASNMLSKFIETKFPNKPVHLIAHSMGGLVSRNFIRLHRDLWDRMRDMNTGQGGRLIMLGTPNFGSFAIPQAFTGVESMVRLLAGADLKHNLMELLQILNTFVGSYQMLPAPSKISIPAQAIYRKGTWGNFPVSSIHLNRALEFHRDLEQGNTVDPERMIYIAGCGQKTLSGMRPISAGEFEYSVTFDGDGRVPQELGLLKDVPSYFVEEAHGDLPKNENILIALEELLQKGKTSILSDRPIPARTISRGGMQWHRNLEAEKAAEGIKDIAERAENKQATPEEVHTAEKILIGAVMNQNLNRELAKLPIEKKRPKERPPIPLQIEIVHGDITRINAPILVIGHYKRVPPVRAEGAIDRALGGWISQAEERGMIGADLGEIFFIPVSDSQIGAKAVLLAGMGEFGKLTRDDLSYLMTNVTYAVSTLGLNQFATVVIGSGEGNLSKERALRGLLEGVSDALVRLDANQSLKKVIVVEKDRGYFLEISETLNKFTNPQLFSALELDVTQRKEKKPLDKNRRRNKRDKQSEYTNSQQSTDSVLGTRLTVERIANKLRISALSNTAVIPVREVELKSYISDGISTKLIESRIDQDQERYGRLLNTYLIPQDFHALISEEEYLTIILDRSTASFPWEMACFRSARGVSYFGPDRRLTRQFRTTLSAAPGTAPPLNHTLKVLIIADPAPEEELRLPGARREGQAVLEKLNEFKKTRTDLDIEIVDRIGSSACDPVDILSLILSDEFDIIHFAGHGIFDESDPANSGWIFGRDRIISAQEIFRARRVPRLVFANACFSAGLRKGVALTTEESNRQLAGIAEAFFERGIQNYIGAGWPVDDTESVIFAETFYDEVLKGNMLGDSLSEARRKILNRGSTWGAYQHYGHAMATIIRDNSNQNLKRSDP